MLFEATERKPDDFDLREPLLRLPDVTLLIGSAGFDTMQPVIWFGLPFAGGRGLVLTPESIWILPVRLAMSLNFLLCILL